MLDLSKAPPVLPVGVDLTAINAEPALAALLIVLTPIVAASVVLTWHSLRGTDPGPAAKMLVKLAFKVLDSLKRR